MCNPPGVPVLLMAAREIEREEERVRKIFADKEGKGDNGVTEHQATGCYHKSSRPVLRCLLRTKNQSDMRPPAYGCTSCHVAMDPCKYKSRCWKAKCDCDCPHIRQSCTNLLLKGLCEKRRCKSRHIEIRKKCEREHRWHRHPKRRRMSKEDDRG